MGAGDVINYTITVKNNGNVTLTGLTISDTLTMAMEKYSYELGPSFSGSIKVLIPEHYLLERQLPILLII